MKQFEPRARLLGHLMATTALLALGTATASAQTGVSDDRVSLPEGPGSLEGIGDDVQIDPNMGQMSYAITINTPDAFGGMAPSLALAYSSGAGGSPVGLGWSLSVPSIERLTLRGVPEYDLDDEFSAGGEQLVYVEGSEPRVYRARFEGSFVRYSWYGHGSDGTGGYWLGEFPDGRVAFFGAESDGTEVAAARVGDDALGVFRYGIVTMTDPYGHHTDYTWDDAHGSGTTSLPASVAWGHDESGDPNYHVDFSYESRTDWLSNATGGFEEILDARVDTIDVYAHDKRIRRYDLVYDDYETSGGFSRLAQVLLVAIDGTVFEGSSTFGYSRSLGAICREASCDQPFVTSMGSIDAVINTGDATLVDMNGDALPDIVDASIAGAKHRIFINTPQSDGSFAFADPYDSDLGTQTGHDLSLTQVQVLDANGDGFTDLMNASSGDILFNTGAGDWSSMVNVWPQDSSGLPTSEAALAALRFMDYDNDRRIDLIGSQGSGDSNITTIYRNTGSGFAVDDQIEHLAAGFDDAMELNDFNGDGLLDAVHVGQSEITYQLNLGWGRWSETRTAGSFTFTAQEAEDAELEDLNGDALADVVLVGSDQVSIWVNKNGREFDIEQVLTSADIDGSIPTKGTNTITLFADMNGNGSSDIVWITPGEDVKYLELFPVKPNLISTVDNGLGSQLTVTYGTSVEHMARDAADGDPWAYKLPFPNVVVDRVQETEAISGPVVDQTFSYHDGYYDGVEKSFRGFETVEQAFAGSAFREEGEARFVYELGADPYDPYYAGRMVSREALSGDRSIQKVTTVYDDCDVAGVPDSGLLFDVRYVCPTEMGTELREGLAESEWVHLKKTMAYDGYGNVTLEVDHGVVAIGDGGCGASTRAAGEYGAPAGDDCLGDEMYTERTFVSPDDTDGLWMLSAVVTEKSYTEPGSEEYGLTTTYYDGDDFDGLPAGQLTHGFATRTTVRKNTDEDTIDAMRQRRDAHGNPLEVLDPIATDASGDHRTSYTYSADGQRLEQTDVHLSDDDGAYTLRRSYIYVGVWDKITIVNDWRVYRSEEAETPLNTTTYAYDNFGRPVSVIFSGGDTGASPTVTHAYEMGTPSRVVTRQRTEVGGEQDVEQIRCLDGRGRVYQSKSRLADGSYQVSGYKVFAAGGDTTQRSYQPYTTSDSGCEDTPPDDVLYQSTYYDALDRPLSYTQPDGDGGTRESRMAYLPLETYQYDFDDTDTESPHYDTPRVVELDGRARTVAVGRVLSAGAEPELYRFTYDGLDTPQSIVDPQGNKRTQTTDIIGRVLTVDDPDRGVISFTYDDLGNVTSRTDARGITQRYTYDGAGRQSAMWIDGDEANTKFTYQWDLPGDCPVGCANTANLLVGETFPSPFGEVKEFYGYDLRAQLTHLTRVVNGVTLTLESGYDNADNMVSNSFPGGLELTRTIGPAGRISAMPGYVDSVTNTERGNVGEVVFANGVTVAQSFDERSNLQSWTVTDRSSNVIGGGTLTRDQAGRILSLVDAAAPTSGPSNSAVYTYDAFGRLVEADLDLGTDYEEILTYSYDSIDNMTARENTGGDLLDDGTRTIDATRPHAVTQVGDMAVTYDAAGNVASRGDQSFTWDGYGRLTGVFEGDTQVTENVYAEGDKRVYSRSGDSVTWYLGDGFEITDGVGNLMVRLGDQSVARHEYAATATLVLSDLAPATGSDDALTVTGDDEINAADAWLAYADDRGYVTLSGATASDADDLLASSAALGLIDWDERITWLHRNQIDTVVAVTDEDGAVVERTMTYPYGLPRWSSTNAPEPYAFTDKRTDPGSGLVYNGRRQYDPLISRFTAVDFAFERIEDMDVVIDFPWESFGAYSYTRCNPIEGQDETGDIDFTNDEWILLNQALRLYVSKYYLNEAPTKQESASAIAAMNQISNPTFETLDEVFSFINFHVDEILNHGVDRANAAATDDMQMNALEYLANVRMADYRFTGQVVYESRGFKAMFRNYRPSLPNAALPIGSSGDQSQGTDKQKFGAHMIDVQAAFDVIEEDIFAEMAQEANAAEADNSGNGNNQSSQANLAAQVGNRAQMRLPPPPARQNANNGNGNGGFNVPVRGRANAGHN